VVFSKAGMTSEVWGNLSDSMDSYMNKKRRGGDLNDLFNKK